MFYILLRNLFEEMRAEMITKNEYQEAVVKVASIHGFRKNGIRNK